VPTGFIIKDYPVDAGYPIQDGIHQFDAMRQMEHLNSTLPPSLCDLDRWKLAHWLMSSGLSALVWDEFFKLKWVSAI
jgi:hypothetical protein